jgi:hypothetical protein
MALEEDKNMGWIVEGFLRLGNHLEAILIVVALTTLLVLGILVGFESFG